jgi:hypothetical protein
MSQLIYTLQARHPGVCHPLQVEWQPQSAQLRRRGEYAGCKSGSPFGVIGESRRRRCVRACPGACGR